MTFKVRVARLAVSVATAMATAGTLVTLAAAPGVDVVRNASHP